MKRVSICFLVLLSHLGPHCLVLPVAAQSRNSHWCLPGVPLGHGVWLDFTGGTPFTVGSGMYHTQHISSATIADVTGDMLFCLSGNYPNVRIYDRTMSLMPGGLVPAFGGGLIGTQGALIVPRPGSSDQYEVMLLLNVGSASGSLAAHLVVDMALNGGFGDVVSGTYEQLSGIFTEKMAGTPHGNGLDYWVVMHEYYSNRFFSYKITSTGLDTVPVISATGSPHVYGRFNGQMQVSLDGSKLGLVTQGPEPTIVQLFHFNDLTGEVSYWMTMPGDLHTFGCEFSSDGCKFYVGGRQPTEQFIDQYSICAADTNEILGSRTRVHQVLTSSTEDRPAGMATGPDGRIYLSHFVSAASASLFGYIDQPNASGAACGLVWNAFDLAPYKSFGHVNQLKRYHDSNPSVGGLAPRARGSFMVAPNPTRDLVWLNFPEGSRPTLVTLTDALGRRVGELSVPASLIQWMDLGGYQPGLYIVSAWGEGGLIGQQRVVVE